MIPQKTGPGRVKKLGVKRKQEGSLRTHLGRRLTLSPEKRFVSSLVVNREWVKMSSAPSQFPWSILIKKAGLLFHKEMIIKVLPRNYCWVPCSL